MIDWTKLAKPQPDYSDVEALRELEPGWTQPVLSAGTKFLLDSIAIDPQVGVGRMSSYKAIATNITDEWIATQNAYLNKWSVGEGMLRVYLDYFWPFYIPTWGEGGKGCSSGHQMIDAKHTYHAVYVSTNDPGGCAQGIYHEAAHLRLESMGIKIETHDGRLLLNGVDELFDSSVRFDKKRPMSAVLHGVYAWLMFTENDYHNFKAGMFSIDDYRSYVERNIPKIIKGMDEIDAHARWTDEGKDFFAGVSDWAIDLIERTQGVLISGS